MASPNKNNYIKYSNIGFQMLAMIGVSAYVGIKLDEKYASDYWTASLTLLGVVLALISVIYKVSNESKK